MKYLVCSFSGHFADDVRAHCATCGASIVHRPHVPTDAVKICERCVGQLIEDLKGNVDVKVTEDTRRELALYYAKTPGAPS